MVKALEKCLVVNRAMRGTVNRARHAQLLSSCLGLLALGEHQVTMPQEGPG